MIKLLGKLTDLETLPCGVQIPLARGEEPEADREFIREYSLQEMTGNVRKMIAGRNVRSNMARIIDTVLEQCVVNIAGLEGKALRKGAFLRSLLVGDRDFLLLKIRLISKGPIVVAQMNCPSCQEALDVDIDLGEMDVYGFDPEKLEYSLDEQERRVFEVDCDDAEATFRFPDGHDQAAITQILRANPIEAQHRMYQRCLVRWKDKDGEKTEPIQGNFFDTLPVRLVDWVDEQFQANLPGPEMDTNVTCAVCGAESMANMESSDFLFPQTQTGRSKR